MTPVEFLWIALIIAFAVIGAVRGLRKELGATTILLLSLFTLHVIETQILARLSPALQSGPLAGAPEGTSAALYYGVTILFVAFISYEGIVLQFPVRELGGPGKALFGMVGGLLNGYLIIGTIWDVVNKANYFGIEVDLGTSGDKIAISSYLTELHAGMVKYLPVSLMDDFSPYVMLVLGMILLLAIVLR
ncbi:MAG: hypothetical protein PVH17_00640 [Anaerolineae bacterium]|jgi:uncharacterized membrane protein required for colicin V production